jgi:hypothetical protein
MKPMKTILMLSDMEMMTELLTRMITMTMRQMAAAVLQMKMSSRVPAGRQEREVATRSLTAAAAAAAAAAEVSCLL